VIPSWHGSLAWTGPDRYWRALALPLQLKAGGGPLTTGTRQTPETHARGRRGRPRFSISRAPSQPYDRNTIPIPSSFSLTLQSSFWPHTPKSFSLTLHFSQWGHPLTDGQVHSDTTRVPSWHPCRPGCIGQRGFGLSGSYQQGYSTAYNAQSHIKVVCNRYIPIHISNWNSWGPTGDASVTRGIPHPIG
jgi:hypothetical protein